MVNKLDSYGGIKTVSSKGTGYFRIEKKDARWLLLDPEGNAFLSIGVNHADNTNLMFPHNYEIYKSRYGTGEKWAKEGLAKDLRDWGFNTIGWSQELISGVRPNKIDWFKDFIDFGHSDGLPANLLIASGMPYFTSIRVQEIEDWNAYPNFRDMSSPKFYEHCDYLARKICLEHADSKNLIGYFFVDIPAWTKHTQGRDFKELQNLTPEEREIKIYDVASKYYETMTEAVRRYDSKHLIFGDRYHGNKGIPEGVLRAMKPYVDVLSIQYFCNGTAESHEKMVEDFTKWQAIADKPVLNADIGNRCPTKMRPNVEGQMPDERGRGLDYVHSLRGLLKQPWFIGWHWCSYLENPIRGCGLKDPWDEPYTDMIDIVREFNQSAYDEVFGD